jgi:hypothetical protein
MGRMKDMMMEREENLSAATDYLVSKKYLTRCEDHEEIVYGGGDFELDSTFYSHAMADRKRGVNGPVPWAAGMEPRGFTDLLKESYEDHPGSSCPRCDKWRAE